MRRLSDGMCRVLVGAMIMVWGVAGTPRSGRAQPIPAPKAPSSAGAPEPYPTLGPYPTLPAYPTAAPGGAEGEGAPLPTRPVPSGAKATKGKPIGPIITFLGAARADGTAVQPISVDKKGIPTYRTSVGSGFLLVVEAKAGVGGYEVGQSIFAHKPDDPTVRPDLEIQVNRPLGNGSPEVCDRRRPNIGGIPAVNPVSFAETQKISDAINDLACRFETFIASDSACTLNKNGDFSYVEKDSTMQFCLLVARAYLFPDGDTLVTVRVRDVEGNPGPQKQMRIRREPSPSKGAKKPKPT